MNAVIYSSWMTFAKNYSSDFISCSLKLLSGACWCYVTLIAALPFPHWDATWNRYWRSIFSISAQIPRTSLNSIVSQCSSASSSFRMIVAAFEESFEICWLTRLAHSTNIIYFWWHILWSSSKRDEQIRHSKKFFSYWMRVSWIGQGANVAVLYVWPWSTIRTEIPGWWHATHTGWFILVWPNSVIMSYAGNVAIDVIIFRDHGVIWIKRRFRSSVRLSMVCTRDRK